MTTSRDTTRLTRDALVAQYHSWGRPREEFLVGAELERHLLRADGAPVPYFGPDGVAWLLERTTEDGWEPYFEAENQIAGFRRGASITLEPGSQFELSTAPHKTTGEVARETAAFVERIDEIVAGRDIHQVALGFTPFADIGAVPWVPKGRYVIMRDYLARTGALSHHMMKGTCATQASFDFSDEADAGRKVRLGIQLGPLTTAMFANSPLAGGKPSGYASWRGHIWTETDPRRSGFPEAAERFDFERWVDWLLSVPMMFYKRGGIWQAANGRTFLDWMGDAEHPPTQDDWDLHLTSVFPEVRVKKTIEVRGADCVPTPLAMAFVALFRGLFYVPAALDRALELAERLTAHGTKEERFEAACRGGLTGVVGGRPLAKWAEELVDIGRSTFDADDLAHLGPLEAVVASGESPAHAFLRAWSPDPTPGNLIRLTHPSGRAA